jgi:tape measure domain-containing protein
MATAELVVAFSAKIDSLEGSLKRVTTALGQLEQKSTASQRAVADSTNRMSESFTKAAGNVRAFVVAYAGIQAGQAIRQIVLAVDDLQASFTRLQVITGLTKSSVQGIVSELQRVSTQTGQPLENMVNQFQRFYVATTQLGASSQQVEQFVSVLARFAQVSGAGPQEAANAITQLAQGLASGRLQGDELRSIMENMPVLAQAIARELGVSVGELRKMGSEGKLTAENVFPAILRAGQRMSEAMRGVPLTLRQAWEAFKTSAISAISAVDSAIGASEWLQRALAGTATAVQNTARRSLGLDYTQTSGANLSAVLQNNRERAAELADELRTVNNLLTEAESRRRPFLTGPAGAVRTDDRNELRRRRDALQAEAAAVEAEVRDLAERVRIAQQQEAIRREREGRDERIAAATNAARDIREQANPLLEATRERDERLAALNRTLEDRRARAREEGNVAEIASINRWGQEQTAAITAIYEREARAAGAGARAAAERADAERRRTERENRQRRLAESRQVEEIMRAAGNSIESLRRQYAEWDEAQERSGSNYEEFIRRVQGGTADVAILFDAVRRQAEQTAEAMYRAGYDPQEAIRTLGEELGRLRDRLVAVGQDPGVIDAAVRGNVERATRSLDQLRDKSEQTWKDIATQGARAFSTDLAGSLIDFATTGESKFDEMAANFAKNIAKMIVQMMILKAIMAGFSAAGFPLQATGGVGGRSAPSSNPYGATGGGQGGAARSSGSSGAASYFLSSGASLPKVPAQQGGDVNIVVYNNTQNSQVKTRESSDSMGNKRIEMIIEEVVKNGFAAGRYDPVMRSSYGVSRPGRV